MLPTPIGRPGPTIGERRSAVLAQSAMRAISHRLGDRVCDLHPVLLADHDTGSAYVPLCVVWLPDLLKNPGEAIDDRLRVVDVHLVARLGQGHML